MPDGYEHAENVYRVAEEWQKPRRGAKKDGDILKDSIPLSHRRDSTGTSPTDKEYR
jgi:hypothetical protein